MSTELVTHRGGCHCGTVTFEFDAGADVVLYRCNCSICRLQDPLHLIIPAGRFRLLSGGDTISTYTFNTGVAKHHFCSRCGIKSFYIPRTNPDGVSIDFRCVDSSTFGRIDIDDFDGENWDDHGHELAHLSRLDGQ